jgi:hypothetical protein
VQRLHRPRSYTEIFFLDEATAFAAGHRPCFECRRAAALAFHACWAKAVGGATGASLRTRLLFPPGGRYLGVQPLVGVAPDLLLASSKASRARCTVEAMLRRPVREHADQLEVPPFPRS